METTQSSDYRYERKYVIAVPELPALLRTLRLHPALFVERYAPRFINNVYFDSIGSELYSGHIDGQQDRVKIRIRWYGDMLGEISAPLLEMKMKRGRVGTKRRFAISSFTLNENLSLDSVMSALDDASQSVSGFPDLARFRCSLLNRYRRRYFEAADRSCRLTLDNDLKYYAPGFSLGSSSRLPSLGRGTSILELKYSASREDQVREILREFPFRMTKFSKYVCGVETVRAM